jgi:hypothetical protein
MIKKYILETPGSIHLNGHIVIIENDVHVKV